MRYPPLCRGQASCKVAKNEGDTKRFLHPERRRKSARSNPCCRSSFVALSSNRRETLYRNPILAENFSASTHHLSYAPKSGYMITFLPARHWQGSNRKLFRPPVAIHKQLGKRMEQIKAVFSDSTKQTGASVLFGSRCAPNRHWESFQLFGSWPALISFL